MSTKDHGGPRRHTRPDGGSGIARSSKLSLLSVITSNSSGSGGSNSTVTQESYTRARKDPARRVKKKRKSRETDSQSGTTMKSRTREGKMGLKLKQKFDDHDSKSDQDPHKSIDVFKYLVEDGGGDDVQTKLTGPASEQSQALVVRSRELDDSDHSDHSDQSDRSEPHSDAERYYRSTLSDSGISMGSSAGETPHRTTLPPLLEDPVERSQSFTPSVTDSTHYQTESRLVWGREDGHANGHMSLPDRDRRSPASMHGYPISSEYQHEQMPHSPASAHDFPIHLEYPPQQHEEFGNDSPSCLQSAPLVFREKNMIPDSKPQLFRSFANLNSRVLLQMQANIAEMEEELARLDAKIVSAEGSRPRRGEMRKSAHYVSRDQARRVDLYQEIHVSLDQYWQALAASHQMNQITSMSSSASLEERSEFHTWLRGHVSPSSRIRSLLGNRTDLIRINTPPSPHISATATPAATGETGHTSSPSSSSSSPPSLPSSSSSIDSVPALHVDSMRIITLSVILNTMIPLIVFKLMSSIIDRLIFWAMVVAASAALFRAELNREQQQQKDSSHQQQQPLDGPTTTTNTTVDIGKLDSVLRNCIISFCAISLLAALFL